MCNWAATHAAKDAVHGFTAAAHASPALCWTGDLELGLGDDCYEGCGRGQLVMGHVGQRWSAFGTGTYSKKIRFGVGNHHSDRNQRRLVYRRQWCK